MREKLHCHCTRAQGRQTAQLSNLSLAPPVKPAPNGGLCVCVCFWLSLGQQLRPVVSASCPCCRSQKWHSGLAVLATGPIGGHETGGPPAISLAISGLRQAPRGKDEKAGPACAAPEFGQGNGVDEGLGGELDGSCRLPAARAPNLSARWAVWEVYHAGLPS